MASYTMSSGGGVKMRETLKGWPAILQVFGGNEAIRLMIRNEIVGRLFKHDRLDAASTRDHLLIDTTNAPLEGLGADGRQYNWQREQNRNNTISKVYLVRPESNSPLLGLYKSAENRLTLNEIHHPMLLKIVEEVIGTYAPAVGLRRAVLEHPGEIEYYVTKPKPKKYQPIERVDPMRPITLTLRSDRWNYGCTLPSKFAVENASNRALEELLIQVQGAIANLADFGASYGSRFNGRENESFTEISSILMTTRDLMQRRIAGGTDTGRAATSIATTGLQRLASSFPRLSDVQFLDEPPVEVDND